MISQTPQVWLDCQVADQFGGLEIGWDVRDDLFPDGVPAAMFDAYVALLGRLAAEAEWWSREGDIVLPSAAPAAEIHPDADTHIAAGFAAQALRTPDAPVVIDAQGHAPIATSRSTRRRCGQRWNKPASAGDTVAVLMPKCAHQLAAVLAIVQAGAAYVPVDSRQPALRQQSILRNARVRAVVSVQALDFEHDGCMRIDIDTLPIDPQWPPRASMKSTATRSPT